MDRETMEIVRSFVAESMDSLDAQEALIGDIVAKGEKETINALFRTFHTIKGISGFLGFNTVHAVTHEIETFLDLLRKNPQAATEDVADVLYECIDVLRQLMGGIASWMKDSGYEDQVRALTARLQKAGATLWGQSPPESSPASSFSSTVLPDSQKTANIESSAREQKTQQEQKQEQDMVAVFGNVDDLSEEELDAVMAKVFDQDASEEKSLSSDEKLKTAIADAFQPVAPAGEEIMSRYIVEAMDLLAVAENGCLRLEQSPHDMTIVSEVFGAVHSLKGNSGFMGLGEIEAMAMDLENILEAVRNSALEVYPGLISMLLTNIDILKSLVQRLDNREEPSLGSRVEISTPAENAKAASARTFVAPASSASVSVPPAEAAREAFADESLRKISQENPIDALQPINKNANQDANKEQEKDAAVGALPQRREIRVDTAKLDKLFDLVGELITIEAMVTNNPEALALESESFTKSSAMLNKITRELQEVVMTIRMMPVEGLFNKMKRLVRDLGIRFDKKVHLAIAGAETEMDKNVIEEISDPLMHIIRNAIDHGLETREERALAGKNETCLLRLSAQYEGNEILIIVEDDGRGLQRQKIIAKAAEKGLLKMPPDKMTDRDVYALIFEPGFSTADSVTDISGRGVGMDVVKRNIEKLQGSIGVESREGRGARFTLRIPITLAIIDAMLLRVGDAVYALPILSVRESFRPTPESITVTMDGLELVRVRNEFFPIARLGEIFGQAGAVQSLYEGIAIVVQTRDRRACIFVDEILGQQQIVVKSLSDYVGAVQGIMGCMILSSGDVGLILDVEAFLQRLDDEQVSAVSGRNDE
jgi:two-component system chemotaxis sensor kinase CheA